jgi:glycosyltransferase involved in cell wall biosynthesis
MRLLTIRVYHGRYGAENHVLRIARGAARRGIEVHAAFPRAAANASMIDDCKVAGVSYWPFDWNSLSNIRPRILPISTARFVSQMLQIWTLLYAVRPDVVQFTAATPNEVYAPSISCALCHIPMLAVFQMASSIVPMKAPLRQALAWARRRRQRWEAVSQHNLPFLQASFSTGTDEIGILTNGIEITDELSRSETDTLRREVRNELELPAIAKILLTTARFDSRKGYADLLTIVPRLVEKFPDAVFVWAGDGCDRTVLEAQVQQQGLQRHVRFLGYRTDVDRLLRASDVFIFPSHSEGGCSSSIREAMVNCLPIVCSDAGGIPEVIVDGIHSLVFPAKNIDRMFARLCDALSNPVKMRSLAEQARKRIEEFSSERMVEDYLAVFRELCR